MKKENLISKIKTIIGEWGSTTTAELMLGSSPVFHSTKNTCQLVESFNSDDVEIVTYVHEQETDSEYLSYEELSVELLEEIADILDEYKTEMEKTMDRCKDENF